MAENVPVVEDEESAYAGNKVQPCTSTPMQVTVHSG